MGELTDTQKAAFVEDELQDWYVRPVRMNCAYGPMTKERALDFRNQGFLMMKEEDVKRDGLEIYSGDTQVDWSLNCFHSLVR